VSLYTKVCKEALAQIKRPDIDPRHLEGFMRLQYGTLGHLPREEFVAEARLLATCWDGEQENWEWNARSYGL